MTFAWVGLHQENICANDDLMNKPGHVLLQSAIRQLLHMNDPLRPSHLQRLLAHSYRENFICVIDPCDILPRWKKKIKNLISLSAKERTLKSIVFSSPFWRSPRSDYNQATRWTMKLWSLRRDKRFLLLLFGQENHTKALLTCVLDKRVYALKAFWPAKEILSKQAWTNLGIRFIRRGTFDVSLWPKCETLGLIARLAFDSIEMDLIDQPASSGISDAGDRNAQVGIQQCTRVWAHLLTRTMGLVSLFFFNLRLCLEILSVMDRSHVRDVPSASFGQNVLADATPSL